jgi:hypothetical protein
MNAEHKPPLLKWAFGGMFLLLGMAPGFYTPVISVVLAEQGLGSEWVERTFLGGSLAGMITPLMICALADNRFASQKVYGTISILSGCFLALAFGLLGGGASPWWFVCLFFHEQAVGRSDVEPAGKLVDVESGQPVPGFSSHSARRDAGVDGGRLDPQLGAGGG